MAERYFTGKPCKKGHIAERVRSNRTCVVCLGLAVKKYQSKDGNKAKVKAWTTEAQKRYIENHPERRAQSTNRYRTINREAIRSYGRAYYAQNADVMREYGSRYKRERPERRAEWQGKRRAALNNACPPWVDRKDILRVYAEAKRLSCQTGVVYSVDHIVPLKNESVCGLHVPWNLDVIPLRDNIKKGARFLGVR
jgi:hypothetical protein